MKRRVYFALQVGVTHHRHRRGKSRKKTRPTEVQEKENEGTSTPDGPTAKSTFITSGVSQHVQSPDIDMNDINSREVLLSSNIANDVTVSICHFNSIITSDGVL